MKSPRSAYSTSCATIDQFRPIHLSLQSWHNTVMCQEEQAVSLFQHVLVIGVSGDGLVGVTDGNDDDRSFSPNARSEILRSLKVESRRTRIS